MTYTLRHKKGLAPQTIFFFRCGKLKHVRSVFKHAVSDDLTYSILAQSATFIKIPIHICHLFTLCYSSIRKPNSAFDIQRPRLPCISLPLYSGFTMAELNHSWRIWRTKEGEEGEECTKLNLTDKRLNGASSLIPHIWGIARPIFT